MACCLNLGVDLNACAAASQVMKEHMICGMGFSCVGERIMSVHIWLAKECLYQSRSVVHSHWQIYNLAFPTIVSICR